MIRGGSPLWVVPGGQDGACPDERWDLDSIGRPHQVAGLEIKRPVRTLSSLPGDRNIMRSSTLNELREHAHVGPAGGCV
jgi:hypothetical protein